MTTSDERLDHIEAILAEVARSQARTQGQLDELMIEVFG